MKCPGPRAYAAKAQVMVMGSMIRIRPIKKIEKPVHPRTSLTQALGASSIVNFDLGAPHSGHLYESPKNFPSLPAAINKV